MLLINGKDIGKISVIDRGIEFGDGCFTTAAISNGRIVLFSEHLSRLRFTCNKLNISFSEWVLLKKEMQNLAEGKTRAVLKVIITRGFGGHGYGIKNCKEATRIIYISSWPERYDLWRKNGVTLSLSPIRLSRNPYLAGLKHLNRLEQVLIYSYLERIKSDEVLVLDSDGWIVECCTANIFWRKKNMVYTPRLDQAGVNGIMRQFCLRMILKSPYLFQVSEVYARKETLAKADEVIICNALMPIIPVKTYDNIEFYSRKLFEFLIPFYENLA